MGARNAAVLGGGIIWTQLVRKYGPSFSASAGFAMHITVGRLHKGWWYEAKDVRIGVFGYGGRVWNRRLKGLVFRVYVGVGELCGIWPIIRV